VPLEALAALARLFSAMAVALTEELARPFVAKCDSTSINPGDCFEMTLQIVGEANRLGLGSAISIEKGGNTCFYNCMQGLSCCGETPGEDWCLTRTIGFWGTQPWITNDYTPVEVCGRWLHCGGAANAKSSPS
jgi:hypothetical protein